MASAISPRQSGLPLAEAAQAVVRVVAYHQPWLRGGGAREPEITGRKRVKQLHPHCHHRN